MLLSHKTTIQLNRAKANIVGHMCYAAYKLWNVCNYERRNYKELGLERYPDWYYQKSHHKEDLWFKSLPSQTAQEVCKLLDKAWRSFYALKKSGGIENPRPPRFKQEGIAITYMQNGIRHEEGSSQVRLSLSKQLKEYMADTYGIYDKYLYLENGIFQNMDSIKQIRIYPPDEKGKSLLIVIYEVADTPHLPDNGHYLCIDLGLHNLMTCFDSAGKSFIVGRKYLNICQRYDKEIARVQKQWGRCQVARKITYPKPSKHLLHLYQKKRTHIWDYLHKVTHYIAEYCLEQKISVVVIGDMKSIRKGKNLGRLTNQKLHSLPYAKIYQMLEYKLSQNGIRFIKQEESYTSQCPPDSASVSKEYAQKKNRIYRGLYQDGKKIYHADAVGAYNILRKYFAVSGIKIKLSVTGLNQTEVVKVAV